MNRRVIVAGVCLLAAVMLSSLPAAERLRPAVKPTKLTAENQQRGEQWIKQLNDNDYFVRERATQSLVKLGAGAIQLLAQEVKVGSAESSWRAGAALEQIALHGDEQALLSVSAVLDSLAKDARPGLATLIHELAGRQQWYRHSRAVEQISQLGGDIQIAANGEGIDLGVIEVAVGGAVEVALEEPVGLAEAIDPFGEGLEVLEEAVDDATRYRLAGVEPVEVSLIDQFKAKAGRDFALPEVAFAALSDVLDEPIGGLREVEERVAEIKVEAEVDGVPVEADAIGVAIAEVVEEPADGFQAAVTVGRNWKGGDAGVAALKDVRGLQLVKFEDSPVTDAALRQLEKVKELSALYIHGGSFSPDALMKFRRQRPGVSLTARGKGMLGIHATGVRIEVVQDHSPAHEAGLKKGDVVRRIAGHEVEDFVDITLTLVSRSPGDKIEVEIERNGEVKKFEIQLAARH